MQLKITSKYSVYNLIFNEIIYLEIDKKKYTMNPNENGVIVEERN